MENKRLESLDILRGLDLFLLVTFHPVAMALIRTLDHPVTNKIGVQMQHVEWEGFVLWDLIMPLFMFMAGVAMPFSFSKYTGRAGSAVYLRIAKRVFLLFLLGMFCADNLLSMNPDKIRLYSNTLQAIAIGYLIASVVILNVGIKGQVVAFFALLVSYWALLRFVTIDGFGGGDYSPDHNLAEYIDRIVLGRFRDHAVMQDGVIDFGTYRYTWIVSSLNFGATTLSGVFAGRLLMTSLPIRTILTRLVAAGAGMMLLGLVWSWEMPIIKKIWTSSMTLFSSGICFLLIAAFHYLIDYKKYTRYVSWLKIYGKNSIVAYMLYQIVSFTSVTNSLFHGLDPILGKYYIIIQKAGNAFLLFAVLWWLYRERKFLKV